MTSDVLPGKLDSALYGYLALVQSEFQKGKEEAGFQGRLRLMLTEEQLLLRLVERVEQTKEFSELAKATALDYREDEFESRIGGEWESHVRNYFRLSDLYMSLFNGRVQPVSEVVERYRAAFRARYHNVTHLVPLEFVDFSEDALDCEGFQIRRFSREDLDAVFRNAVKKIFYKWAYLDLAELHQYWFLHVMETRPAKEPGRTTLTFSPRVTASYSEYPEAVESALARLALYNWDSHTFGTRATKGLQAKPDPFHGPFRPHIPFVISCSDCLIDWPRRGADLSVLMTEPVEELGERPTRACTLIEQETEELKAFMRNCSALIGRLQPYRNQWGFVETALGFLVKGFTAPPRPLDLPGKGGLEQLLWHITAIEAVLGQNVESGLTKLLLTRVSTVLGRTKEEQKDFYKRFGSLYSFRSDLVHGNAGLASKEIYHGHLTEARNFARTIVVWMLGYLGHVVEHLPGGTQTVPSREDLLSVLDMGNESRHHTAAVLEKLPTTFPNVEDWLTPGTPRKP